MSSPRHIAVRIETNSKPIDVLYILHRTQHCDFSGSCNRPQTILFRKWQLEERIHLGDAWQRKGKEENGDDYDNDEDIRPRPAKANFQKIQNPQILTECGFHGAGGRTRTDDLLITNWKTALF